MNLDGTDFSQCLMVGVPLTQGSDAAPGSRECQWARPEVLGDRPIPGLGISFMSARVALPQPEQLDQIKGRRETA